MTAYLDKLIVTAERGMVIESSRAGNILISGRSVGVVAHRVTKGANRIGSTCFPMLRVKRPSSAAGMIIRASCLNPLADPFYGSYPAVKSFYVIDASVGHTTTGPYLFGSTLSPHAMAYMHCITSVQDVEIGCGGIANPGAPYANSGWTNVIVQITLF